MHASRPPYEEACPVSDSLLGDLYRADPNGLGILVETIPATVRAMLAIYCYPRGHLASLALAIASSCEKSDLIDFGGDLGAALFEQARRPRDIVSTEHHGRRKVSLSTGPLMQVVIDQDLV